MTRHFVREIFASPSTDFINKLAEIAQKSICKIVFFIGIEHSAKIANFYRVRIYERNDSAATVGEKC